MSAISGQLRYCFDSSKLPGSPFTNPGRVAKKSLLRGIDTTNPTTTTIRGAISVPKINWRCVMKRYLWVASFALVAFGIFAALAIADDERGTLVRFEGGIGVHPVSNVTVAGTPPAVTVNANIIRGVNPAGQIWVIDNLDAKVKTNGDITVKGKGLILAGGNTAGRATGQSVFATLICEAATPFTLLSTDPTGVQLAPNGDFKIDDVLVPLPPATCASPMLLIRTAGSGNWFAAGILVSGKSD
jgi:hypothetical protein